MLTTACTSFLITLACGTCEGRLSGGKKILICFISTFIGLGLYYFLNKINN